MQLYTGEVLALATGLADYPLEAHLPLKGAARSRACGSTLELGLSLDPAGRIDRVGLRASACAIGQAAAALFARSAHGRSPEQIAESLLAIEAWLAGEGDLPDWPGLGALAAAADYPSRHGALTLAWKAACIALSTQAEAG